MVLFCGDLVSMATTMPQQQIPARKQISIVSVLFFLTIILDVAW
jgi:hypothetical protein